MKAVVGDGGNEKVGTVDLAKRWWSPAVTHSLRQGVLGQEEEKEWQGHLNQRTG